MKKGSSKDGEAGDNDCMTKTYPDYHLSVAGLPGLPTGMPSCCLWRDEALVIVEDTQALTRDRLVREWPELKSVTHTATLLAGLTSDFCPFDRDATFVPRRACQVSTGLS